MRGLRSTIALVVVLIGLGAYIYFVTSKKTDTGPTEKQLEKLFPAVTADNITDLEIHSESGDVTSLKKDGSVWEVTAPVQAQAAEAEANGIVTALSTLEVTRVIDENPTDVKDYGLDPPQSEVKFKSSDGKVNGRLLVGLKTATGGGLYARRNDEKRVVLIPAYQESVFNKSTLDLRDKSLVSKLQPDKIDSIELVADGKTIQLSKTGSEWKIAKPVAARADYAAVEGLLGRLQTGQAKSIVTDAPSPADLKKYGLDKPSQTITLGSGSARTTVVVGGSADDTSVYARDLSKPAVMTIEKTMAGDFKKSVEDLRRKDLFDFREFNATNVEITRGANTIAFERVKGTGDNASSKWRRVSPNPGDVQEDKIEKLLNGLDEIRASSFTDSTAKTGVDSPLMVVHAKFDDGKREERVSFGRVGQDTFAARPDDPGAAKIDGQPIDDAMKTLDELAK